MASGWTFRVVLTGKDENGVLKVSAHSLLRSPNIDFLQLTAFGNNESEMVILQQIPHIQNRAHAFGVGAKITSQFQTSIDQSKNIVHFEQLLKQARIIHDNRLLTIFYDLNIRKTIMFVGKIKTVPFTYPSLHKTQYAII